MTVDELKKVPFRFVSHLAMETYHAATYVNEQYGFTMCVRTRKKDDFTFGRTTKHYRYEGVVYKSLPKFLEAIKDVVYEGE